MGAHHFSNFITKLEEKKRTPLPRSTYMQDNNHVGSRMSALQQHYILVVSGSNILSLVIQQQLVIPLDVSL